MRTCYLHIGMPKTGTTSIQASLGEAATLGHFKYISFGKLTNCSNALLDLYGGAGPISVKAQQQAWSAADVAAADAKLLRTLRAGFDSAQHTHFLLSGERLHNLQAQALALLRTELLLHVDEVKVVAYVREACSYMESAFQQRIKTGSPVSLDHLYPALPHYQKKLARFDKVFGAPNVLLWKFEPRTFPQGNVVLDLCQRLGIPFDPAGLKTDNESISRDAAGLLHIYRSLRKPTTLNHEDKRDVRLLMQALRALKGPKLHIAPELLNASLADAAGDLAWIETRLGVPMFSPPQAHEQMLRSDADLLTPTATAVAWLGQTLALPGWPVPGTVPSAEEVARVCADWVARLNAEAAPLQVKANPGKGGNKRRDQPTLR